MASSPSSPRAPLLWLLLPLGAGFVGGQLLPPPGTGLGPVLATSIMASATALWAARQDRRSIWAPALVLAVGLQGFALLHLRFPHLHEWSQRPPREQTLLVQVVRPFANATQGRTAGGIAVIDDRAENGPEDRDRIVYYSVIRRLGPVPQRTGVYRIQGVLEPMPPRGATAAGFDDFLINLGVRQRLVRGRVLAEIQAPSRLQAAWTAMLQRFREILSAGLQDRPAERSLYLGIVLGEKTVLTPEQQNAFVRSGTYHVFSVSGLHVGAIAYGLYLLCGVARIPERVGAIATILGLWGYVQVTGGGSPALRAFLMVAFVLAARVFLLPQNSLAAISAAALATLLVEPLQIFSSGFQISYGVVLALILMHAPLVERNLARWRPFALLPPALWRWWHHGIDAGGRKLVAMATGCWVAFLASVPAGIGYFGVFSPGSLFTNLLVIPASTGILYLGVASMATGVVGLQRVSVGLNSSAATLVGLTDSFLQMIVAWPGVAFPAQMRAPWLTPAAMVISAALMLVCARLRWAGKYGGFWPPVAFLALLVIFGVRF